MGFETHSAERIRLSGYPSRHVLIKFFRVFGEGGESRLTVNQLGATPGRFESYNTHQFYNSRRTLCPRASLRTASASPSRL